MARDCRRRQASSGSRRRPAGRGSGSSCALGTASSTSRFSTCDFAFVLTSTTGDGAGHGHRLFERADFHVRVDGGGEVRRQFEAVALEGLKSRQRERDGVGAGTQIDDAVRAFAVGDDRARFFDEHVARRFDRHAGQHRARRVLHDARRSRSARAPRQAARARTRAHQPSRRRLANPFNASLGEQPGELSLARIPVAFELRSHMAYLSVSAQSGEDSLNDIRILGLVRTAFDLDPVVD